YKTAKNPENWHRNRQKKLRSEGKKYVTRSGKNVGEKEFLNKPCYCSKQCSLLLSSEERNQAMMSFYSLECQNQQNMFIHDSVRAKQVDRYRSINKTGKPKSNSFEFY